MRARVLVWVCARACVGVGLCTRVCWCGSVHARVFVCVISFSLYFCRIT